MHLVFAVILFAITDRDAVAPVYTFYANSNVSPHAPKRKKEEKGRKKEREEREKKERKKQKRKLVVDNPPPKAKTKMKKAQNKE